MIARLVALVFAVAAACAPANGVAQMQDRRIAAPPNASAGISAKDAVSGSDIGDVWWPNDEPGWGIQFVQNAGYAFATMYVYDAAGRPTFFVASLTNVPFGTNAWTGPLSATTGPYYKAPFDPAAVVETVVGTMTFVRQTLDRGSLDYTVGNVSVSKTIHRQPLKLEVDVGEWQFHAVVTGTSGPCDNEPFPFLAGSWIRLDALGGDPTAWLIGVSRPTDSPLTVGPGCTVDAAVYAQAGRVGRFDGEASCHLHGGLFFDTQATVSLTNIHARRGSWNGYFRFEWASGCVHAGRFAALSEAP